MADLPVAPEFCNRDSTSPQHGKAAAQLPKYTYKPLPDGQHIRMLTLYPGQPDELLRGKLELVDINSSGTYEPLSYVWGKTEDSHQITIHDEIGDGRLKLTDSLYGALRRIRYVDQERRLWADQICINQEDMEERSQQVQFMNMIYKNASEVLVWLGPADQGVAEPALKLIDELDEIFEDEAKFKEFHIDHTEKLMEQSRDRWNALDHLTALPWFTRYWIVQEIGTKAPATLFWGEAKINWMRLYRVCDKLTDYHHLRSRFNIRTSDIKYVFQRFIEPNEDSYHANRFSFMYELHRARGLKVTDPRDRVFAMLGHYSVRKPNAELAAMKADYEKTIEEVYVDVAQRALRGDLSLIALAAVQHMTLPSTKALKEAGDLTRVVDKHTLPSWVPDWRTYQTFIMSEPVNAHCAHGTQPPKLTIDSTNLTLSIHGIEIDPIETCSKPLLAKEFHLHSHSSSNPHTTDPTIKTLWHSTCGRQHFDLHAAPTYPNGDSAFFAYMQTLSNGCVQIATRGSRPYHEIPEAEWLALGAAYLVDALGRSSADVAPEVYALAAKTESEAGGGGGSGGSGGGGGDEWSRAANGASKNRVFARTKMGYYVLGPKVMEVGDVVCVLFGGKMPFCLRPWGDKFLLVGECYVHGLMRGEAVEKLEGGSFTERGFDIV